MSATITAPIAPLTAFQDNYIWLLQDDSNAYVVDPGEALPVIDTIETRRLKLAGILLTHHHHDHSGGIATLLEFAGSIPVIGSAASPIKQINHPVTDGEYIELGSYRFYCLAIPGHTLDHMAYYTDKILFSGDTLFSAGCGRIFEGTASMLYQSIEKLKQLPDKLEVYCGHEYTLANLRFAKTVEPHNPTIEKILHEVESVRAKQRCTLPSTLALEKQINPFMRCDIKTVKHSVEQYANKKLNDAIEVFRYLREWKNHF